MPTAEEQVSPQSAPPVRQLGKYELVARIGEGGMAEVYLAHMRGPMNFQKVVVVKTIHPDLASQPQFLGMLFDEARVSALIKHPRVVDIYELGHHKDTYFIAMEYLDGQTLARVMAAGVAGFPLEPYGVARIIADAAEGLHAAHELKSLSGKPMELVHRDVSPGNIMVLYDGTVKVLDFGVAKARGRLTHSGARQMKGKLGYMAPEQLAGRAVDRRSDVYSLGVVMWETLALRRLFPADSYQKVADTMVQDIQPPSSVSPQVPPQLDEICLRALSVDPAARYQTAGEMRLALDTVLHEAGCFREGDAIAKHMIRLFGRHRRERHDLLMQHMSTNSNTGSMPAMQLPIDLPLQAPPSEVTDIEGMPAATLARGTDPPPPSAEVEVIEDHAPAPAPQPTATVYVGKPRRRWPAVVTVLAVLAGGAATASQLLPLRAERRVAAAPASDESHTPPPPDTQLPSPSVPAAATAPVVPAEPPPEPADDPPAVTDDPPAVEHGPSEHAKPTPRAPSKSAAQLYAEGADLFVRGNQNEAKARFKAAIDADPNHAPAYRGLGLVYQAQGKKTRAIAAFQKYLQLAPDAKDAPAIRQRIAKLEE